MANPPSPWHLRLTGKSRLIRDMKRLADARPDLGLVVIDYSDAERRIAGMNPTHMIVDDVEPPHAPE